MFDPPTLKASEGVVVLDFQHEITPEFEQQFADAAAQLHHEWPHLQPQQPQNDLHPDPARIAFDLAVLTTRFEALYVWAKERGFDG